MAETINGKTKTRLANTLTRVGSVLGGLGAISLLINMKAHIAQLHDVQLYKGFFLGSAVLIVLGAIWGRQGRQEMKEEEDARKASELTSGFGSQLDYSAPPLSEREHLD